MREALLLLALLLFFSTMSWPVLAETGLPAGHGPAAAAGQGTSDETAIELTFWNSVKDTKDPAILQTYLDRYPNGAFAGLARVMMERLVKDHDTKQPAPAPIPTVVAPPQPEAPPAAAAEPSPAPSIAAPPQPETPPAATPAATEPAPEGRVLTLRATLKAREGASRPYLGVQIGEVTEAWAKVVGMTERKGALVLSSLKNSPAEFAGAQPGDVIVKAGDTDIASPEGMTSFAVMLVNGKGVTKDEAEAIRLLRMAAGGGHARATYVLGVLTLQGQGGIAKDPTCFS